MRIQAVYVSKVCLQSQYICDSKKEYFIGEYMIILSPSLLSANLGMLCQEVILLQSAGIPWVHWDVMDGSYVPNITLGSSIISSVRDSVREIFFDVHLMIEKPEHHIDSFIKAGANLIVIHTDATAHPQRVLEYIRSCSLMCGVALNPHEHPCTIEYLLPYIDVVLVMGVNPGFSGQRFLPSTLEKIGAVHTMIHEQSLDVRIQVDGGVSESNIQSLHHAGVEIFVSGSSFFTDIPKTAEGYRHRYESFLKACEEHTMI